MERQMSFAQWDAFRQLGLRSDADEATVRRAYAQRLKTCSPETDPQGWMRLHSAFKTALSAFDEAASSGQGGGASSQSFDPDLLQGEEENSYGELFGDIEHLAGEAEEEEERWREAHELELREAQDRKRQALCQEIDQRVNRIVRQSHFRPVKEDALEELLSCRAWRLMREENRAYLRPELERLRARRGRMTPRAIGLFDKEDGNRQIVLPDFHTWMSFQSKQNASDDKKREQKANRRILLWVLGAIFLFAVLVPSGQGGRTTSYNYTYPHFTPLIPSIGSHVPRMSPIPGALSSPAPAFDRSNPVSEVQNSAVSVLLGDVTLGECIRTFAEEDGVWSSEGERVTVSAGKGEREFFAVFSLDSADSDEAVVTLHPSNRSEPLYVLSFRICGRNLRGQLNTIFFTMKFSPNPVKSLESLFQQNESKS